MWQESRNFVKRLQDEHLSAEDALQELHELNVKRLPWCQGSLPQTVNVVWFFILMSGAITAYDFWLVPGLRHPALLAWSGYLAVVLLQMLTAPVAFNRWYEEMAQMLFVTDVGRGTGNEASRTHLLTHVMFSQNMYTCRFGGAITNKALMAKIILVFMSEHFGMWQVSQFNFCC